MIETVKVYVAGLAIHTLPIPLRQDGGKEFKHHKFIVTYIFAQLALIWPPLGTHWRRNYENRMVPYSWSLALIKSKEP